MTESNAVVKQDEKRAETRSSFAPTFRPQNLTEAITLAKMIANSELAPKDFKGKPENCLIAIQMGAELGLAPMQAIQNIAVINGRPSMWGDAALGLVQSSGLLEWIEEKTEGTKATCTVKRVGYPSSHTSTFSDDDAKKAGLLGKQGPWSQYQSRMRQMRARGFALRDMFADVLKGLILAEEASDYPAPQEKVVIQDLMPRRLSESVTTESPKIESVESAESEKVSQSSPEITTQPEKTDVPQNPESEKQDLKAVSEVQTDMLTLLCRQHGVTEEKLMAQINGILGVREKSQILAKDFNRICSWVEKHQVKK